MKEEIELDYLESLFDEILEEEIRFVQAMVKLCYLVWDDVNGYNINVIG